MREPSLYSKLKQLFQKNLLYTVDELSELTKEPKKYVRVVICRLKNPKYTRVDEEPLDLVIDIDKDDRVKRWGLRGASIKASAKNS